MQNAGFVLSDLSQYFFSSLLRVLILFLNAGSQLFAILFSSLILIKLTSRSEVPQQKHDVFTSSCEML